jgi:hypothetical protein
MQLCCFLLTFRIIKLFVKLFFSEWKFSRIYLFSTNFLQRRQRGDLIQVFRILNDFDQLKWNDNQTLVARRSSIINTRSHNKRPISNCV